MGDLLTVHTVLESMTARGAAPAIVTVRGGTAGTISHNEFADRALRLAAGLADKKIRAGEAIALWAPNSADLVAALFGTVVAGGLPLPIDDVAPDEDAVGFITDAGCRLVFTSAAHLPALQKNPNGKKLELVLLEEAAEIPGRAPMSLDAVLADEPAILMPPDPAVPALLVYTSGTTGAPKAFTLSHANLAANLDALVRQNIVGETDRCLMPLPLHHVYPFMSLLLTFACGASVVFPESVSGPHVVEALKCGRATAMAGVPRLYDAVVTGLENRLAANGKFVLAIFRALLAAAIGLQRATGWRAGRIIFRPLRRQIAPDLARVYCGGAKLSSSLNWKLEGLGWEVLNGYGLSETASVFTGNLPRLKRIGTDGRPFVAGCEMRISARDDTDVGEIQLRGPSVFSGYRTPVDANAAAFTSDGWFRTGDLGRIDTDGFLDVTGRIKEMIVLGGGENIQPEPLEKTYGASPYIAELALLERDGVLSALVVPDMDAIRKAASARIDDRVRVALSEIAQTLPSFQRLAGFAVTKDALPRTRLGKLRRFLLPDIYDRAISGRAVAAPARLSGDDRALTGGGRAGAVWKMLKQRHPDRELSLDDSPELDLGIDSLGWVTLGLELQSRFGIVLAEQDLAGVISLRDLLRLIAAAQPDHAAGASALADHDIWLERPGLAGRLAMAALFVACRCVMKLAFRLRREAAGPFPPDGPCLLVANHASYLDSPALLAALPWAAARRIRWSGDRDLLFSTRLSRAFCRLARIFPVDGHEPLAALAMAEKSLGQGDCLAWFPEAWRSPDGRLQRFQSGIGRLLTRVDVPIVPVWIEGAFDALPRHRNLPRLVPVSVRFGAVVTRTALEKAGRGDTPEERIADGLRRRVSALAPDARSPEGEE